MEKKKIRIPSDTSYSVVTGTPIIIRIPKNKFNQCNYNLSTEYNYIYWKKNLPITFFINQVEDNIIKKYYEYSNYNNNNIPSINLNSLKLFEKFIFKKQVSTKIRMKESTHTIIGTLWEFQFEGWENKEIVEYILDSGLGERNSLGFGFMNLVTKLD